MKSRQHRAAAGSPPSACSCKSAGTHPAGAVPQLRRCDGVNQKFTIGWRVADVSDGHFAVFT